MGVYRLTKHSAWRASAAVRRARRERNEVKSKNALPAKNLAQSASFDYAARKRAAPLRMLNSGYSGSTSLYPNPRTVINNWALLGSGSRRARSRRTRFSIW